MAHYTPSDAQAAYVDYLQSCQKKVAAETSLEEARQDVQEREAEVSQAISNGRGLHTAKLRRWYAKIQVMRALQDRERALREMIWRSRHYQRIANNVRANSLKRGWTR
jgi:predicted solute-binding protein